MRAHRRALTAALGVVVAAGLMTAPAVTGAAHAADPANPMDPSNFDKVPLVTQGLADPFELDVADDGRVIYIQRTGEVRVIDQETLQVTTALDLDYPLSLLTQSDGLLGLTLDNDFQQNGWLYLMWSDPQVPKMNLSRFTMGANNVIDRASEKRLLDFTIWRGEGRANSHMGGSLAMDSAGNLYAATGDNADPFDQSGFTPLDERPGRRAWDAQATSANTNDLRGKILRIHPEADGTYSIPAGNLFTAGTEKTRPEIYGMGFRNPFRITVDPETDAVLIGDYGPDARSANPLRGPEGMVELVRMTGPGNHGWPYCHGNNQPYVDYDWATRQSGATFNCAAPVNESPNNTGLRELPPSQAPMLAYGYGAHAQYPDLGSGGAGPMAGPVYRYDPDLDVKTKFPQYFDGKWFVSEYTRNRYLVATLDEQTSQLQALQRWLPNQTFVSPFEAEFGPDGSLYIIDFGRGNGAGRGSTNTDAGIYRIDYVAEGRRPVASFTSNVDSGQAPLAVQFHSAGSHSPDGLNITYAWDFNNDKVVDSTAPNPTYTYTANGQYTARLTVTDTDGSTGVSVRTVTVGNTRPTVAFTTPLAGGFAELGDTVPYAVRVTDAEDGSSTAGTIDCDEVAVNTQLGHDTHAHPLDNYTGCSGSVYLDPADHGPGQNVYPVLGAGYTDLGAPGVPALSGQDRIQLQVRDKEAEFYTQGSGVQTVTDTSARGDRYVGDIDDGDWVSFDPVDLSGIHSLTLGARRGAYDSVIEVRVDSPTGPKVGEVKVAAATAAGQPTSPTIPVGDRPGTTTLYLVFKAAGQPAGGADALSLDWLVFHGRGVADDAAPTVTATAARGSGNNARTVSFNGFAFAPEGRQIDSYTWDFGDGTTAEGARVSHTYAHAGQYTARLIASDSEGARDWTTIRLSVPAVAAGTALDGIATALSGYTTDGTISERTAANVRFPLDRAIRELAAGSELRAIGYLEQFVARVENQVKGDAADLAARQALVSAAEAAIAELQTVDDTEDSCQYGYGPSHTVHFGTGDAASGVPNYDLGDGCTVMDAVMRDAPFTTHSAFLGTVDRVTAGLVDDGVLSAAQRTAIRAAAEASRIGRAQPVTRDRALDMSRIGLVGYTVRAQLPAPSTTATLQALSSCGYQNIEPSGSVRSFYGYTAAQLAPLAKAAGLQVPSLGVSLGNLQNDLPGVIAEAKAAGATYVRISGSASWNAQRYAEVAAILNEVGEKLAAEGITVAFHNHDYELVDLGNGVRGLDILIRETNPEYVAMELDLHWAARVGTDLVGLLQQYPGRFPLMHLKDLANGTFADVGTGTIDFASVFANAELAGLEYGFVEHDNPRPDGITSACNSMAYLEQLRY
ncbi:PKD domain-containing protein [Motilibacter aurantiacus]|uniref:PKD domain-containing protein n=1 Tax=Motilibacter aurantiacus TaxID=2714955 RepID=UPI0018C8A143|nr:PKD domain-containing protein [Motilibacter aurantiacus]NHC46720.1 PKD domain-containing protein [Motilibacter aurantiacus]